VKSPLLRCDDDLPGSHGGIAARFGELFIRSGKLDKALGREIHQALEKRNRARYRYLAAIGRADAEEIIEAAERITGAARELLDR
jgi:uncharacterized protein (UPF0332 family)